MTYPAPARDHVSHESAEKLTTCLQVGQPADFRFLRLRWLASEVKMAAAEADREVSSALCSEYLNFSAKDTAAVSDSFHNQDNMF